MTTRQHVCAEAMGWLRTPYHHLGDIKGVGADCAMLLVRVYADAGLVPATLDPRPYSTDWHLHRNEEKYLAWVEQYGTQVDTPKAGDITLWRFGRTYSHGAIVLDEQGTIIHAYRDAGAVVLGSMRESQLASRPHVSYSINGIKD